MQREKANKCLGSDMGRSEKISINLFEGEKSIFVESAQEEGEEPELSSSSSNVPAEDIIEFGLHWMKLTTTAVYDENEREILDPEIDVGDTGPDLKQFFA